MRLRIPDLVRSSANYMRSPFALAATTILLLTMSSGIVQGRLSGRWRSTVDDDRLEKKLADFPRDFGSWQLQESLYLTPYVQSMLECRSYLHRRYVHRDTGQAVNVAVLVGPPGPISVHTPEICYSSRDYELREDRQQATFRLNETQAHVWKNTFYPNGTDTRSVRVYYAWNDGRGWKAPEEPRFSFVGRSRLYKIQLAAFLPSVPEGQDDPCSDFLEQFLPALEPYLVKQTGKP